MSLFKYQPLPPIHTSDDELTNYRTDFKAHPVERPQFHQPDQYVKPQGEMDTNTSYKQEYTGKSLAFCYLPLVDFSADSY